MESTDLNSETVELLPRESLKDRFNLVYLIIFFTGIGVLLPWNYFTAAEQYFIFQLNTTHSSKNYIPSFENNLAIFSMIPMTVTNILNLFLRRHIRPMKRFNFGVSTMFVLFTLTLVLTKVPLPNSSIFFWITMATVAILNICSGLIQGSSLGIVSMMPRRYIKGFMEGQSLSGVLASASNILSILAASQPDESAFIYFFLALILLLLAGVGFCSLGRIKFSKEFVFKSMIMDSSFQVITNVEDDRPSSLQIGMTICQRYLPLLGRIRWYALSCMMTFLMTLTVYPAFTSSVISSSDNLTWKDKYFTPVVGFLLFNMADYFGRFLCGYLSFPSINKPKTLFFLSLLRWILVPLLFLCKFRKKYYSVNVPSDIYPIALMSVIGISNGYLMTLSCIYAPSFVYDNEKEAVGTLMALFSCLGLTLGVSLSYILHFLI